MKSKQIKGEAVLVNYDVKFAFPVSEDSDGSMEWSTVFYVNLAKKLFLQERMLSTENVKGTWP